MLSAADALLSQLRDLLAAHHAAVLIGFCGVLGACLGSFINAFVYRWPRNLSVLHPTWSFCPACKHPIRWHDNLPVLGWFLLRGRCRDCRGAISFRYPLVEALCAALFVATAWWHLEAASGPQLDPRSWRDLALLLVRLLLVADLLAIALVDADYFLIPLVLSIPLMVAGPVVAALDPLHAPAVELATVERLGPAALGALAGLAISQALLMLGILPRSYRVDPQLEAQLDQRDEQLRALARQQGLADDVVSEEQYQRLVAMLPPAFAGIEEPRFQHRREMLWELLYLAPPVGLAIAAAAALPMPHWLVHDRPRAVLGAVLGFLVGGGLLWYVRLVFTLCLNRQALGLGDVHLIAGVGALLGWFPAVVAFFVGPLLAIPVLIVCSLFRLGREVPFGPWLCVGAFLAMLGAETIWSDRPGLGRLLHGLSAFASEHFGAGPLALAGLGLAAIAVAAGLLGLVLAILGPVRPRR